VLLACCLLVQSLLEVLMDVVEELEVVQFGGGGGGAAGGGLLPSLAGRVPTVLMAPDFMPYLGDSWAFGVPPPFTTDGCCWRIVLVA